MEFLDITSMGMTYIYVVNIEHKFKQKRREFGFANSSQPKQEKYDPNRQNKGRRKYAHTHDNQSKPQHKGNEKSKKEMRKWCEYHKILWHNTEESCSKNSLVVKLKAFEWEVDSDYESNLEGEKRIIDVEPNIIVATTKVQPSEPKQLEEGEHLFHSRMWAKGAPLHFIVYSGSQKNLILV